MRDVIHAFNERGLAALDPRWAGGRPRLISDDDDRVHRHDGHHPTRHAGLPVHALERAQTRRLPRAATIDRRVQIGRERLRQILREHHISFQRTRTWKESTRPGQGRQARPHRVRDQPLPEPLLRVRPVRAAVDPALPRHRPGHRESQPIRLPATYHRTHGIRYFHGCYSLGDDQLWGVNRRRKGGDHSLSALKSIRAARPDGAPIYVIMDNLSANKTPAIRAWAARNKVELCLTPTSASWANPIEAQFGPLRTFTMGASDHPNHPALARRLQAYLRWRNTHARHPDVLAAQRRERARIRSERHQRWGRPRAA